MPSGAVDSSPGFAGISSRADVQAQLDSYLEGLRYDLADSGQW